MKRFKVGVIGYGWVATAHIPAINATSLGQVTAVYSSRQLNAGELSTRHGCAIKTYRDIDAMLDDPEIDVVSICSMPKLHPDQAIKAARSGKHLCG